MTPQIQTPTIKAAQATQPNPLREKAAELETAFLSEMLGYAGLGTPMESFGGGIGEEQFSSFLRQEQAEAMVKAGGIGLTEVLFRAMSSGASAVEESNGND
jgi:Rod binding domain-containing protein